MEIKLYSTKSNRRSLTKKLTHIATVSGTIKGTRELATPQFVINNRAIDFNYCVIQSEPFNDYYFLRDEPILDSGGHLILNLEKDLLMSHRNEILASPCIAERSTSNYNPYMPDGYDVTTSQKRFSFRKFPFEFDTSESGNHYIMTIGGK